MGNEKPGTGMADIINYIHDINASMAVETTLLVKIWMNWMALVFFASIFFLWKRKPARLVFGAMLATMAAVLYIWHLTKNVHLFGVAHILIWLPLAAYLWGAVLSRRGRETYKQDRNFYVWIWLLVTTIIVSLIFDVRDIYLVMMDQK